MALFSVNQATQMYVGNATTELTSTGDQYYLVTGPDSKIERTDIIKKDHILYQTTKTVAGFNSKVNIPKITVGTITKGNEYVVRLTIVDDFGVAAADIKTIAVVAEETSASGNTASANLAEKIATALNKAAARDLKKAYVAAVAADDDEVVTITPEMDHILGKKFVIPQITVQVVNLKDDADTMVINGDPAKGGWVSYTSTPVDGSGLAKLKDYEYFLAGEKGDQYRGVTFPNDFPFVSKLNLMISKLKEELEEEYDDTKIKVNTIHYYEDLSNEAVQKSEKTIVIVGTISAPPADDENENQEDQTEQTGQGEEE